MIPTALQKKDWIECVSVYFSKSIGNSQLEVNSSKYMVIDTYILVLLYAIFDTKSGNKICKNGRIGYFEYYLFQFLFLMKLRTTAMPYNFFTWLAKRKKESFFASIVFFTIFYYPYLNRTLQKMFKKQKQTKKRFLLYHLFIPSLES